MSRTSVVIMGTRLLLPSIWGFLLLITLQGVIVSSRVLDMTYLYNNETWYHHISQKGFTIIQRVRGLVELEGTPLWLELNDIQMGEHVGTHMDAPCHVNESTWRVHQIPPDRFIAAAVMVDIRYKASLETPDVNVTLEDVQEWERQNGRIPERAVVFQCSGWGQYYGVNETKYWGNEDRDLADWHFPGFGVDAVRWLIDERGIIGLAVDTPSIDYGASSTFASHVYFSSKNVYGLEHTKDTCELPPRGATAYIFPINTEGGSGGPTRVVAIWGEDSPTTVPPATDNPGQTCAADTIGKGFQIPILMLLIFGFLFA